MSELAILHKLNQRSDKFRLADNTSTTPSFPRPRLSEKAKELLAVQRNSPAEIVEPVQDHVQLGWFRHGHGRLQHQESSAVGSHVVIAGHFFEQHARLCNHK